MASRHASRVLGDTPVVAPVRPPRTVRATYQRLRMSGLTPLEAGNLTAHLNGLRATEHGWTLEEIENLLFVRALLEQGRLG